MHSRYNNKRFEKPSYLPLQFPRTRSDHFCSSGTIRTSIVLSIDIKLMFIHQFFLSDLIPTNWKPCKKNFRFVIFNCTQCCISLETVGTSSMKMRSIWSLFLSILAKLSCQGHHYMLNQVLVIDFIIIIMYLSIEKARSFHGPSSLKRKCPRKVPFSLIGVVYMKY